MRFKFRKMDGSVRVLEGRIAKKQPNIEKGQVIVYETLRGVKGRLAGSQIRSFRLERLIND